LGARTALRAFQICPPDALARPAFNVMPPSLAAQAGEARPARRPGWPRRNRRRVIISTCHRIPCGPRLDQLRGVELLGVCATTCRAWIWWGRAAGRPCRNLAWRQGPCFAGQGVAGMCFRFAWKFAARLFIWMTTGGRPDQAPVFLAMGRGRGACSLEPRRRRMPCQMDGERIAAGGASDAVAAFDPKPKGGAAAQYSPPPKSRR